MSCQSRQHRSSNLDSQTMQMQFEVSKKNGTRSWIERCDVFLHFLPLLHDHLRDVNAALVSVCALSIRSDRRRRRIQSELLQSDTASYTIHIIKRIEERRIPQRKRSHPPISSHLSTRLIEYSTIHHIRQLTVRRYISWHSRWRSKNVHFCNISRIRLASYDQYDLKFNIYPLCI